MKLSEGQRVIAKACVPHEENLDDDDEENDDLNLENKIYHTKKRCQP